MYRNINDCVIRQIQNRLSVCVQFLFRKLSQLFVAVTFDQFKKKYLE